MSAPIAAVDSSLQALTGYISPNGVSTLLTEAVTLLVQQSITAPPTNAGGASIPQGYCTLDVDGVSLSGGSVSQLSAKLTSSTQQAGGVFAVSLNAGFTVAYSSWHEWGEQFCTIPTGGTSNNPFDDTYGDFWFVMASIAMSFDLTVQDNSGQWVVTLSNAAQSNANLGTVNIPSNSVLNDPSLLSCINDRVRDTVRNAILKIDLASKLQSAINSLIGNIPSQVNLTAAIVYRFAPTFVSFPNNSGIAFGISGQVLYNGTPYSGTAAIAAPASDPGRHITLNIGTYEFDALLWAFFQAGEFNATILPASLGNPAFLNTDFYKTLLPALYNFAPGADMSVGVSAAAPPVLSNATMYYITNAVLASLKAKLPTATYTLLAGSTMKDVMYPTRDAFDGTLKNLLSSNDYAAYDNAIATAATATGMFSKTGFLLSVNVLKQGNPVFAFSITVEKDDLLSTFQFGVIGTVQTLGFKFSEYATAATLVKSAIGAIDPVMLTVIWDIVDENVDLLIQKAGTAGVPLPFIHGFLLENAAVTLQPGFVAVATDISFTTPTFFNARRHATAYPHLAPRRVHRLRAA